LGEYTLLNYSTIPENSSFVYILIPVKEGDAAEAEEADPIDTLKVLV